MMAKKRKKVKLKKRVFLLLFIALITLVLFIFNDNPKRIKSGNKDSKVFVDTVVKFSDNINNHMVLKKKMSLFAVGDVLIHESVYKDAYNKGTYNFSKMFTDIEPIIKNYDLKFCNQESTIGGKALGISGYPSFNSPDEIGDDIVKLGFNLISLANNHALDRGENAILYSNAYWKTKDVITAGAYSSEKERDEVHIYEKNGIKYAFFAYTTISNAKIKKDYLVNRYSAKKAKSDISKVKDKVDVIIVSMHWGVEYKNEPTESQKQIAEYLSSLGVNVIIGTHPHVVEPVTFIDNTLVIYSLGNFISNQLSIGLNPGIGLMVGVDIVLNDDGSVTFENLYKELILAYAEHSTKFRVIPFSKLTDKELKDHKNVEKKYMKIVNNS